MSKKMMSSSPCRRKLLPVLIPVLLLALVAGAFGIYRLATYESANHAQRWSQQELLECNSAVTTKAQTSGRIAQQEVLVLHSLQKSLEKDSTAVFYIYRLPQGADAGNYLGLTTDEIDALGTLTLMGTLSCRMLGEDIDSIYGIKVTYQR